MASDFFSRNESGMNTSRSRFLIFSVAITPLKLPSKLWISILFICPPSFKISYFSLSILSSSFSTRFSSENSPSQSHAQCQRVNIWKGSP